MEDEDVDAALHGRDAVPDRPALLVLEQVARDVVDLAAERLAVNAERLAAMAHDALSR